MPLPALRPRRSSFLLLRRLFALSALLSAATTAGCIHTFWRTDVRAVPRPAANDSAQTRITVPVKAHLVDGSTVLFREGAWVSRHTLTGMGQSYALLTDVPVPRSVVPMDSVVGIEAFEGKVLSAPSVTTSVAATALGVVGTVGLMKAIFGSCPTVYADTGSGPELQAEGFSYAIAPLLEHRDTDVLRAVRAGADGVIRLDLRNEALETHHINHVELLAVRHAAGTRVVPDQRGRPVVVGAGGRVVGARDRAGRDVRDVLATADGRLFASASATVRSARVGDLDDWIDLDLDNLPPGDSVAVVLRLRNSLLNTVLLYEGMLGGRDAPMWLTQGLQHIGTAVELSRWYVRTMGLRASVHAAAAEAAPAADEPVARLSDVGPIAFRDVALVLPRPARDARALRVRLRFAADNWRIDEVAVGASIASATPTVLPVKRVVVPVPARDSMPVSDVAAQRALADADDQYLETLPGQRMVLEFTAPAAAPSENTTFVLAWQGWYREWIRGGWLAEPTRTTPFVPGDAAVLTALRRWTAQQDSLERAFHATRVPVR